MDASAALQEHERRKTRTSAPPARPQDRPGPDRRAFGPPVSLAASAFSKPLATNIFSPQKAAHSPPAPTCQVAPENTQQPPRHFPPHMDAAPPSGTRRRAPSSPLPADEDERAPLYSPGAQQEPRDEDALGYAVPGDDNQRLTTLDEVVLLALRGDVGYMSFFNDSVSYVLRGCILVELALRGRVRVPQGVRAAACPPAFSERRLEVLSTAPTGDAVLDDALRTMHRETASGAPHSVGGWVNLLAGESWNLRKMGLQVRQVRERIAKGLAEKGVVGTARQSFVVFEMATHPLADRRALDSVVHRVIGTLVGRGRAPCVRDILLVCAALAGNVLDVALERLTRPERAAAIARAEDMLRRHSTPRTPVSPAAEVLAGVLAVFARLDSLVA